MSDRVSPTLYYRLTWQLEIVVVGLLLMLSEVSRPATVLPFLAISLLLTSSFAARLLPWHRVLRFAIGAGMVAIVADLYLTFSGIETVVEGLIALITGALPLLLMSIERPRSYWLATLNISVIAVGSISLVANPGVYVVFIVFMVLLLLNLNAANLHLPDAGGLKLSDELPTGYFRQFMYVMPIGFIAAAVIFVAFPRARVLSLGINLGLKNRTGYTGVITLEGAGEIETSQEVAFLAKTHDMPWLTARQDRLLFRGQALDTFDGRNWSAKVFDFKGRTQVPDLRSNQLGGDGAREIRVMREPTHETTLFYPGILMDIIPNAPGFGDIQVNANGTIVRRKLTGDAFEYTVRVAESPAFSDVARQPLAEFARRVSPSSEVSLHALSARDLELNLAVPDAVSTAPYFAEWRREVGIDPERQSLLDAIGRLQVIFAESFKASMANKFSDANTLAAFLTKDRRGHCEYFASATALSLRSLGVPARVIVGYRGGTFNRFINMLEIREENAHAWVEVFVPGAGWYPVDLTPAGASPSAGALSSLRLYANALSFWFRQYVVDYDFETQRSIVKSIRSLGKRDSSDDVDWQGIARKNAMPVVVGVATLGGMLFVLWRWRRRQKQSDLPEYYVRFAELMRSQGKARATGETYARFHARIENGGEDDHLVRAVGEALERELYGARPAEAKEAERLLHLVQESERRQSWHRRRRS